MQTWTKVGPQSFIKEYKGAECTMAWTPSNYAGTIKYTAVINGQSFSSASWDNLKKQIHKASK